MMPTLSILTNTGRRTRVVTAVEEICPDNLPVKAQQHPYLGPIANLL